MRHSFLIEATAALLWALVPAWAMAQEASVHLVATTEIAAQLSVGDVRERVTGRASFHLIATPGRGEVAVRGFNLAFFGVPQQPLAGRARIHEPLGVLAFGAASGKKQSLRYDPGTRRVTGELRAFADASFLSLLAKPAKDGKGHAYDTPTFPAVAQITIELEKPLPEGLGEYQQIAGKLDIRVNVAQLRYDDYDFRQFRLQMLELARHRIEVAPVFRFEVAQSLCVQPVRLVRRAVSGTPLTRVVQYSGAGLAFGEPGARAEWAKSDVTFDIRDWKTLVAGEFWELNESEIADLLSKVDDDDCIEIFFVNSLTPDSFNVAWGGGGTFGSGTASAQIFSTDANARGGIDLTHLAHELGHVLGLRHPGDAPAASSVPASTGTLMCPSGFLRDNPRVNSQENADLLSNPLLTFSIKRKSMGPDCQDSADCGACP